MYKYYLEYNSQKTEIPEPVGWDGLELIILRNEKSHGIGATYSDLSLKFYGETAISILEEAYNTDIDSEVILSCENDDIEEYQGKLDFEGYGKYFEDGYCYITAKVVDNNIQTVFNNRQEQKVDIDSLTALDGESLTSYEAASKEIDLPSKTILLISNLDFDEERSIENIIGYRHWRPSGDTEIYSGGGFIFGQKIIKNEFEVVYDVDGISRYFYHNTYNKYLFFRYFQDKNLIISNPQIIVDFDFDAIYKMTLPSLPMIYEPEDYILPYPGIKSISFDIMKNGVIIPDYHTVLFDSSDSWMRDNIRIEFNQTFNLSDLTDQDEFDYFFSMELAKAEIVNGSENLRFFQQIRKANIEVRANSKTETTKAKISLVHETTSRIVESITNGQLNVKSDYYGRTDSNINPTEQNGTGSFRGLTNGLRIRNAIDPESNEYKFTLSFSDIIKGLQPIDNIGYGISFENGCLFLRIESWFWFYKNDIVFEINNSEKKERTLNSDETFSILKIGYKKYETESTNGLDAIHTEREYRTRLKLKANTLEQISEFIADGYAIEITRRKSLESTTDWRYDNDTFIICLGREILLATGQILRYLTDSKISNASNIIDPNTVINARISPARMAKRWMNKVLQFGFGNAENMTFTSGTGNLIAQGSAQGSTIVSNRRIDFSDTDIEIYKENQNFTGDEIVLLPENIKISDYPITKEQYSIIKDNPYGTIMVDDVPCFIKEIKYKMQKNTASFVLIPKKV
jgi:hypothetical protein